ncbi:hypothetical protein [Flavilitoribacter nigricans]|uniref:Glycosyltransferase RgtA/B/C/D-like domain-containing protein n=1 Tax=Flavilitoribacter nigricans (strain ATCC 23147 / DSM 23189 / NBRC 102662 / NCIMB 1420 / SS-2) TaxID=1122177 RepID=A0A2D0N5C7_FLAN2|nr:hypothetical protein [Flavilitoribacter nigricans]PHN03742.1 hypothetical protein CRP01_24640 [Flavilitoribacter nigricans DSM 23189 = NBRC 102662]
MNWRTLVSRLASGLKTSLAGESGKLRLAQLFIVVSALVELGMLSFLKGTFDAYTSSFLMLLSGLAVGFAFLYLFYGKKYALPSLSPGGRPGWQKILLSATFLIGFVIAAILIQKEFDQFVIEDFYTVTDGSDVIPQIGILVDRFLSGEFPYRWIYADDWGFNHHLFPTYLPLTWMPFIIPDLLGLDYRWFAFFVLAASFAACSYYFVRRSTDLLSALFLTALPFIFLIALIVWDHEGMFSYAVETQVVGFYLFLSLALMSRSNWLRAVSMLLCLLSRYALVLWIPLFLVVVLIREPRKNAFLIAGLLGLGVAIIYGLPFLSQDWTIFQQGYDYHTTAAFASWELQPWQQPDERPFALYKGLGFGWWFYEHLSGTLVEKVNAYRQFHAAVSLGIVLLSGVFFWLKKEEMDYRIFLLGSFKIYLVIFYNFIQIPFGYIYMVPIILSLPIIGISLLSRPATQLERS